MILTQEMVDTIATEFKIRDTEIERLKIKLEASGTLMKNWNEENDQLKKEREWLIRKVQEVSYVIAGHNKEYVKQELLKEMQQALKEK